MTVFGSLASCSTAESVRKLSRMPVRLAKARMYQRSDEAQVVEHGRAQLIGKAVHVLHRLFQERLRLGHGGIEALADFGRFLFEQLKVHADRRQRLPHFVVQLTAD